MFITFKLKKIYILIIALVLIYLLFSTFYAELKPVPSGTSKMEFRIAVDPGHGGIDTGTHYGNLYEKHINLSIASILTEELRKINIVPIQTRIEDRLYLDSRRKDLSYRPRLANEKKTDLFISIHVNNFPSSQPSGSQVFYKSSSEDSKILAEFITEELSKIREENNRVIKPGDYYVLNAVKCPAVLIETGFISNPEDRHHLTSKEYQQTLALAIKNAVTNYFQAKLSNINQNNQKIDQDNEIGQTIQQPGMSLYYLSNLSDELLTRKDFSYPTGAFLNQDFTDLQVNEIAAISSLKQLMEPPGNLISPFPEGVSINLLTISNGTAIVDLSEEMHKNFQGGAGTESLILEAIAKTLFSIPGIDEIEILIDGEKGQSIGGHIILGKFIKGN